MEKELTKQALLDAYTIGATGAPHSAGEHALFREYLRGHCWGDGAWQEGKQSYADAHTRVLYAVWRAGRAIQNKQIARMTATSLKR